MAFNKRDKWRRRRRNPHRSLKVVWRVIWGRWCPRAARRGSNAWGWLRRDWPTNALTALAVGAVVIWALAVIYLSVDLIGLFFGLTPHVGEDRFAALRYTVLILVALIGAPILIWRTVLTARQTKIAQETHFTDLFTKAAEQLGADKIDKSVTGEGSVPNFEVRLGAIYALERIMHDSIRDRGPIVETLSAYVRENCGNAAETSIQQPPVGRHDESVEQKAQRLSVVKDRVSSLKQAWLVDLPQARPITPASRVDIVATLNVLARRPVSSQYPDLTGANLQGADLSGLTLDGVMLRDVRLEGAILRRTRLERSNLENAHLEGAVLQGALLAGALLVDARMEGVDLWHAHLEGANLWATRLDGGRLWSAHLNEANLMDAHLEGADFSNANLEAASLLNARLEGAIFNQANMDGVDLKGARLDGAVLSGASLKSARAPVASFSAALVVGADFTGSDIKPTQLLSAFGDVSTVLPTGPEWAEARMRLVLEAGWAEHELELREVRPTWAKWRRERGL